MIGPAQHPTLFKPYIDCRKALCFYLIDAVLLKDLFGTLPSDQFFERHLLAFAFDGFGDPSSSSADPLPPAATCMTLTESGLWVGTVKGLSNAPLLRSGGALHQMEDCCIELLPIMSLITPMQDVQMYFLVSTLHT